MTVISRSISQAPRVSRKTESCVLVRPRCHQRNAPSPAVSMKAGAQIWVTHRVRKRTGVVVARLVGEPDMAPRWTKSRTWSIAMMIMTGPREGVDGF